jgi:hypothetical protein
MQDDFFGEQKLLFPGYMEWLPAKSRGDSTGGTCSPAGIEQPWGVVSKTMHVDSAIQAYGSRMKAEAEELEASFVGLEICVTKNEFR